MLSRVQAFYGVSGMVAGYVSARCATGVGSMGQHGSLAGEDTYRGGKAFESDEET